MRWDIVISIIVFKINKYFFIYVGVRVYINLIFEKFFEFIEVEFKLKEKYIKLYEVEKEFNLFKYVVEK